MDIRTELQKLPPPDPTAPDRVWQRYRESRGRTRCAMRWAVPLGLGLACAAAGLLWVGANDAERSEVRTVAIEVSQAPRQHEWSDVVALDVAGQGRVTGTDRNVEIAWESGTITAHVTPNTGTQLAVVTDEARVEVVGTVFSVTRNQLGVTTTVEKGRVKVACASGWEGFVTPTEGSRTCLPVRPALLLARADALSDQGASAEVLLDTLDRGVSLAEPGSVALGELLVRRMRVHGDAGAVEASLADARAYLALGDGPRSVEVNRYAGWNAMSAQGCAAALPFLAPLESAGTGADRVLLAECLASSDASRARALLESAVSDGLDATWSARAQSDLAALGGR
ncbi:MAG: FecR domain-containing protein [Myxococcota bacterium]